MDNQRTHWVAMFGMFVATVVINLLLVAYTYGKMESRVAALERQAVELRSDWKAARERIERAIKERQ